MIDAATVTSAFARGRIRTRIQYSQIRDTRVTVSGVPNNHANVSALNGGPPDPRETFGMRLYFVRHGESEANIRQVFSNFNRDPSHGLTDRGRAQVERLAEQLVGIPFAAFYSSPVLRARQSAEILSARLGVDYVVAPALAEYDVGELEGRSDAASWRRYYEVRDAWFRDKNWSARIRGGESFDDIRARFVPFIDGLLALHRPGPALLLGHGGTFHCMLPIILSNVSFELVVEHGMGHTSVVIAEQQAHGLECIQWGETGRPGR
jgi:probable phosphoglycerate mutase